MKRAGIRRGTPAAAVLAGGINGRAMRNEWLCDGRLCTPRWETQRELCGVIVVDIRYLGVPTEATVCVEALEVAP